jgi:hypothetical protein
VSVAVLTALATYTERETARELVHALAGDFKVRWARTDVNT